MAGRGESQREVGGPRPALGYFSPSLYSLFWGRAMTSGVRTQCEAGQWHICFNR